MTIRPLDLLDLPTVARYRNDVLTLDSTRALTRGHPFSAVGLLAYINPARHLYSAINNGEEVTSLGGIVHTVGETYAKLLYLAPSIHLQAPEVPELIEHLVAQAGEWSAFHVLAEVDESSDAFLALRIAGFSVYAWQRMWDVSLIGKADSGKKSEWRRMRSVDLPAVQTLYYQIVPPLLHPVEPAPNRVHGFVHEHGIKSYVGMASGTHGIVLTPLIHPEENDVISKIESLVKGLPDRNGRKVYLCVRSYQTWLEPALEDLGAQASPRQAVMVKRLTRTIKEMQPARVVPANVTVPASRISRMGTNE